MKEYRGIVVIEDLNNQEVLQNIEVKNTRIIQNKHSKAAWHVLEVVVSKEEIDMLGKYLKENCYMHFWKGKDVIAIFSGGKYFKFNYEDKRTWESVLKYIDFLEIPRNQIDFSITGL